MRWRVFLELTGADEAVRTHEVLTGDRRVADLSADTVGLTLAEGKSALASLQAGLIQAQGEAYSDARRRCLYCDRDRALKEWRVRRLVTLFGTVELPAPRFKPCRCGVASRRHLSPLAEIMPDCCTPEFERILARMGSLVPYARAAALLAEFLPLGRVPAVETARRRTLQVGARLERASLIPLPAPTCKPACSLAIGVDGGHVKSIRSYQARSFEVLVAHAENDQGRQRLFSTVSVEADREREQLGAVLRELDATSATPVTVLTDGAAGPRSLGEAASPGPTRHVLDWFHLAMRIQHVAQSAKSWPNDTKENSLQGAVLADDIEHIRWRLWHGQVQRALDLIGEVLDKLDGHAEPYAHKIRDRLRDLETYVSGYSASIIDYAARRSCEPISTATTESTVQRLLHRRMTAKQQMRWSPRGAHRMLKVRTAVMNGTFDRDHASAARTRKLPYPRVTDLQRPLV
jgi:hypothetical protein